MNLRNFISPSSALGWYGDINYATCFLIKNLLAHAEEVTHVLGNTRAVPLALKSDAHKGRVFFLPKFEAVEGRFFS